MVSLETEYEYELWGLNREIFILRTIYLFLKLYLYLYFRSRSSFLFIFIHLFLCILTISDACPILNKYLYVKTSGRVF